ncbi:MAG: hypothetical protein CML33_03670 [Rhodobacteraceae bacterium]|nr:hypothetical protein [Paracoccaceae bacterium]
MIIGLGEIGVRHLQSLATASGSQLCVVDPAFCSEERKKEVFRHLGEYTDLEVYEDLGNFTHKVSRVDVAVIATTSAVRPELFTTCVGMELAESYLLEKLLAPNQAGLANYRLGAQKLRGTAVINCPQRTFPAYQSLLSDSELVEAVEFTGDQNAGLACNIIHYIDLVEFFTGCSVISGVSEGLHTMIASKRSGYIDFLGSVEFRFNGGATLRFTSDPLNDHVALLRIKTDKHTFEINEVSGEIRKNGVLISLDRFPYQSEMTAGICASLMSGKCSLTTLDDSIRQHEVMYDALEAAYFRLSNGSSNMAIS